MTEDSQTQRLRARHELEQVEARIYYRWRGQLWSVLRFAAASAASAALCFAGGVPAAGWLSVGFGAADSLMFVRHTARMRRLLGRWPWRVGR